MFQCIICFTFLFSFPRCSMNPPAFDEVKWRNKTTSVGPALLYAPHFKDDVFYNPWIPMEEHGFERLLRWKFSSRNTYTEEEKTLKAKPIPNLKERVDQTPEGDFIAWIGHATFLIRAGGEYWLTDPMFSDRALLPKRLVAPALSLEEIGKIRGKLNIIVSHNHYDHLDKPSLRGLPDDATVFVPLGLGNYVGQITGKKTNEMDWWEEHELGNGVKIVCLPAQHWSRRITQGVNKTLWASFLIITPNVTIYYGGDSGYFAGYKEIGKVYPKIDYALMPVGAYHPRWFMHYAHMNVVEVLDAFNDLGAKHLIPTQWGTFQLGDEPASYPVVDLKRTMEQTGFDSTKAIIMEPGQIIHTLTANPGQ